MTGRAVAYVQRRWLAHGLLAAALLLCACLIVHPPSPSGFYPACPIHRYLHIECPGCGATRALAALLQGNLVEALRLNALFVVFLPFALAVGGRCYLRATAQGQFRWPVIPAKVTYAMLLIAILFGIARNVFHPAV